MVDMFSPGRLGSLELKNRLIRSATWEGLADPEGRVTDKLIRRMVELARGEAGLIILGITAVSPEGKGMPGMTGLFADDHLPGHQKLVEEVSAAGGRIAVQLAHVGAQASPEMLGGREPVGPSAVPHPAFNVTPRELATDEVKRIISDFGKAAERAVRAGYHAIQIHAAHGYLVNQFLSPRFNQRKDEFGDLYRFPLAVFDAVKNAAGRVPVFIKLNLDDLIEDSVTPEIALPLAERLAEKGIAGIEVSAGGPAARGKGPARVKIKDERDEGYFLGLARMVKERVSCPVIAVGGFRSPAVINRALSSGDADFVSMARPFIREPHLVKRWKSGDLTKARCISCNGCFNTLKYGEGVQCWQELKAQGRI